MALSRGFKKVAENGKDGRKSNVMSAMNRVGIASIYSARIMRVNCDPGTNVSTRSHTRKRNCQLIVMMS